MCGVCEVCEECEVCECEVCEVPGQWLGAGPGEDSGDTDEDLLRRNGW